jgi:rRNA-processing protein FCF1
MTAAPKKKQPLRIIVDSNALFIPIEFKIDIITEMGRLLNRNFELVLISPVKRELEFLAKQKSLKMRKNANFALGMAEKCTFIKVQEKPGEHTDEAILRIAQDWGVPVFTNDKLLKQKLRDISIPTIYLREKSRLEIDGLIS